MDLKRTMALGLISSRLSAPGTGYLWLELVENAKMAESVHVSITSSFRDHVLADISVTLAPGVSIEALEAKLQQTLDAFLAQAKVELNDQQTNRLKKTAMSTLAYMHDDVHGTAAALATHLATGFPLPLFEEAPQTLATLRSGDLQKEAREWLTQPFPVTSIIFPPKDPDPSLSHLPNPPKEGGHVMHLSRANS
jgi:predicted Zn-dependent peptidase